jgi:hypothetical protein
MAWHLAPSLSNLRDELNKMYPNRPKTSDGSIGNAAHKATKSDHNPNSRNSVNALDITYPGVNFRSFMAAAKKHPSTNYVIFNRKIYSRSNGWVAKAYTGVSPHTEHIHISILQTIKAENSQVKWFPVATKVATKTSNLKYPGTNAFKVGAKNSAVKIIQKAVGNPVTGTMTKSDVAKVKRYQLMHPKLWPADGIVGPKTYISLLEIYKKK